MKTDTPQTIHLRDYAPPAYFVDTVDLDIDILAGATTVTATLACRRNPRRRHSPWCSMATSWKRCASR